LRADLRARLKKEKLTFWARTKRPDPKAKVPQRTQLCMNIIHKDTNLVYCVNDSILLDPEVTQVLFDKSVGDTTYQLIHIDAFTKSDNELCRAGHETKIFFVRWNHKTNKAIWKYKNIASCTKGITFMSPKNTIKEWDRKSQLDLRYNRSFYFYEIRFDPEAPQLGIQTLKDEAKEAKEKEGKKEE
jgi:hypothetical protein